ncbi:restriction endonuclease [Bdellovibrio sp. HCB209]|uniref:restriction endonuclease n=1 Tax=Bdellovibrio sp. HCB209 TaxID=3394354 RepID=UPI0039B43E43
MILLVVLVICILYLIGLKFKKKPITGESTTAHMMNFGMQKVFKKLLLVGLEKVEDTTANKYGRYISRKYEIEVPPVVNFHDNNEIVITFAPSVPKARIKETVRGLGVELHKLSALSSPLVLMSSTGYANQYRYKVSTEVEAKLHELLEKAGLCAKRGDEYVYPSFHFTDSGAICLDCSDLPLNIEDIKGAIDDFNTLSDRKYSRDFVERVGKTYLIHPLVARELDFGRPIEERFNVFNELVIKPMREYFSKNHQMLWYIGELYDGNMNIGTNHLFEPMDSSPHMFLAGVTGSGKSESAVTILSALKIAHGDDVRVYVANGMDSTDLDSLANYLSDRPVAYNGENLGKPALCYLNDMLLMARKEAVFRAEEFRNKSKLTGNEIVKIQQYRKYGFKMPEIVIFVDEFRAFMPFIKYNENKEKENTVAFLLQKILAEYRKYGIHLILGTQKTRAQDVPKDLADNLGLKMIHRVETDMQNYLETIGMNFGSFSPSAIPKDNESTKFEESSKGRFILPTSGYHCKRTGGSIIPGKMPYLSFNRPKFYASLGFAVQIHKPWDDSVIINVDDIDPFNEVDLYNRFNKAFFQFHTSEELFPISSIKATFCFNKVEVNGKTIGFGFVSPDECTPDNARKLLSYKLDGYVWVLTSDKDTDGIKKMSTLASECPFVQVWPLHKYRKELIRNLIALNDQRDIDDWFVKEMDDCATYSKDINKKPGFSFAPTDNSSIDEGESKWKIAGVTTKELERIAALKGHTDAQKIKKGKLFELFIVEMLKEMGNEKVHYDKSLKNQFIPWQDGDGDYGLDIVIEKDNELILGQCKNFAWNIGNKAVQQIVAAKSIVEGYLSEKGLTKPITQLWVFGTNDYTTPAETQAKYSGVQLVDMATLRHWVKEVEDKKPETRGRKAIIPAKGIFEDAEVQRIADQLEEAGVTLANSSKGSKLDFKNKVFALSNQEDKERTLAALLLFLTEIQPNEALAEHDFVFNESKSDYSNRDLHLNYLLRRRIQSRYINEDLAPALEVDVKVELRKIQREYREQLQKEYSVHLIDKETSNERV